MTISITVYIDSEGKPFVKDTPYAMPKNDPNKTIHWVIDPTAPQAVTFTDTGITFTPPSPQFSDAKRSTDGKHFHWKDKNSDDGSYAYLVAVMGADKKVRTVDPVIENGGNPPI
jgi:hypothetical protein